MTRKGLWLLCCIGILIILVAAARRPQCDGFQDYLALNTSGSLKEVFIVKKTCPTQDDAAAACREVGASLATLEQMRRAQDASANWCTSPAWIAPADSTTDLYYPSGPNCSTAPPSTHTCESAGVVAPCLRKVAATAATNKYAACYGLKPAEGTNPLIGYFDGLLWSLFDTDLFTLTMNGKSTSEYDSTMGLVFTPAQALYGLEQTYSRTSTPRYDPVRARQRIADNLATINGTIQNASETGSATTTQKLAEWVNGKEKTCNSLNSLQTELTNKVQALKVLMDKINAYTNGAIAAKDENIGFQQEIAYICRGMTSATSPACKRIAELDYELYFKNLVSQTDTGDSVKVLADLENLNMLLYSRQCEIRAAARRIQVLWRALSCDQQGVQYNAATLGNNFVAAIGQFYPMDPSDPCADLSGNSNYPEFQAYLGEKDTRFTSGKTIPYANSELLKLSLDQLSPYFSEPGYSDVFDKLIISLSLLLRIPQLNDYNDSAADFKQIDTRLAAVRTYLPSLWS